MEIEIKGRYWVYLLLAGISAWLLISIPFEVYETIWSLFKWILSIIGILIAILLIGFFFEYLPQNWERTLRWCDKHLTIKK